MKRNKLLILFVTALLCLFGQSANAAIKLTALTGDKFGDGEGCQKLVDGTQNTKWGTWSVWYHVYENDDPAYLIAKADLPIAPTTYELVIANDTNGEPGRNWKAWRIYAANFASDADATLDAEGWVLIDEKVDQELPTGQFEVVPLEFSNPDGNFYSYFKIVVDDVVADDYDAYCQMDEFRFKDYKVDTSAAQEYMNFDLTSADADLAAAYNGKLDELKAAFANEDVDQIVACVATLASLKEEITAIMNGNYIALDWTACWGDGPGSNLVDKNDNTKWGGNFPGEGEHVQYVVFRGKAIQPFFYKLVTGGDTERWNTRNWKSWRVFGGNFENEAAATRTADGWVLLDERTDITSEYLPNKNNYPATFDFNKGVKNAYSYFKVEVTASGGSQQQMSEMYLCTQEEFEAIREPLVAAFVDFDIEGLKVLPEDEESKANFATLFEELKTTADAVRLTKVYNDLVALRETLEESAAFKNGGYRSVGGNTAWGDNENWTKLIDGNSKTKWGGGMPDGGSYNIFKSYDSVDPEYYMLITGNDTKNSPGRNWKTWKIYGGNFESDEAATREAEGWVEIDSKENIGQDVLPGDNFTPAYFTVDGDWDEDGFNYFKIEVSDAYDGGSIQMSEFRFLDNSEWKAARQEYVDSLTTLAMNLSALQEELELPAALKEQVVAEITTEIQAKIGAVASAKPNTLLPKFNEALQFITVLAPASVTLAEKDGVYQISNGVQMFLYASKVNGGETSANAVLTADINLDGVDWTAIGTPDVPFKGTFDGQDFAITGFVGTTPTATGKYGLFGNIDGATVKNFSIAGTLTVPEGASNGSGVIGWASGGSKISSINSTLVIEAGGNAAHHVAGVVGSAQGGTNTITNCVFAGSLTVADGSTDCFAGIVGYISSDKVTNCVNLGTVDYYAANCYAGGIVGYINNANLTIANCLSVGAVTYKGEGSATYGGAIIGRHRKDAANVKNNYWLEGSAKAASSEKVLASPAATSVTAEQLASGEIAYKLNGEQSESVVFYQTIGEDAVPVLDTTHSIVYPVGQKHCDGTPYAAVTEYTNDASLSTQDDHDFVDGFCSYCGVVDESYMAANEEGFFEIAKSNQLKWFAGYVAQVDNTASAVLTSNIDLSEVITEDALTFSIGTNAVPFKGTFDGQGKTISNITYTAKGQYNGLFGKLSSGAVVKNFTAEGTLTVSADVTGRAVALIAVAGDNDVLISNINSKINYNNALAGAQVGGILGGFLNGTVTVDRCTYSGTLDGNDAGGSGNYAGIAGYANNNAACTPTISNCLFVGKLINTAETPGGCTFGGFVGYSNGAAVTIKNCLSIGTIQSQVTGQFFGAVKSTKSSLTNCYYVGENVNGSASTVTLEGAVEVTDKQLASGEVAYNLGDAFRQTIGVDENPVLDATHGIVKQLTNTGWATLYIEDTDVEIPEDVSAFAGVEVGEFLNLKPIEGKIAAGEPVVWKAAYAGYYSFVPTTDAVKAEENDLKGAAEDIEAAGKYVLAKPEGSEVGFYLAETGTIKAGKAYLESAAGVKAFFFGEAETGISDLKDVKDINDVIFDLSGRRVNKAQKGIYIINGKKVLK